MHIATVSLSMAPFCLHAHAAIYSTYIIIHSFPMQPSYRYSYILVVATYNITFKNQFAIHKMPFNIRVNISGARMHGIYSVSAL